MLGFPARQAPVEVPPAAELPPLIETLVAGPAEKEVPSNSLVVVAAGSPPTTIPAV